MTQKRVTKYPVDDPQVYKIKLVPYERHQGNEIQLVQTLQM